MNIRKAHTKDVAEIVDLLVDSFKDDFRVIFGKNIDDGKKALRKFYNDEKVLKNIFIAKKEEKLVGICCFKMKETEKKWSTTFKIFIKNLGFFKGIKALILGDFFPISFDEEKCLLDFICVDPKYRSQGIAERLIEFAERNAVKYYNKKIIFAYIYPLENITHHGKKIGFKEAKIKKSIISKIFFKKPFWIYIEKKISDDD